MKVILDFNQNLLFTAKARHFKDIQIDEPESFHGTDLGPSSVEYVLIGIGGCLGSTFIYCLQKNDVSVHELQVIVDGTLRHVKPDNRLKLINIDVEFLITVNESIDNKKIESCETIFREFCPLSTLISKGIPLNIKISKK